MAWVTEDNAPGAGVSPLLEAQCLPCIKFFNPVFVTNSMSISELASALSIDGTSHLNHYIVETGFDVTFTLNPVVEDSVDLLGLVVLITRNTLSDVFIDDSLVDPSILRGLKQIDSQGDTIGLISVTSSKFVIAGATRLVV